MYGKMSQKDKNIEKILKWIGYGIIALLILRLLGVI